MRRRTSRPLFMTRPGRGWHIMSNGFRRWFSCIFVATVILVTVAYVGCYIAMSRRAFAYADALGYEGFYFLEPEDSDSWRRWNYTLVRIYLPLIWLDLQLGTGRVPAPEPTWRISSGNTESQRQESTDSNRDSNKEGGRGSTGGGPECQCANG